MTMRKFDADYDLDRDETETDPRDCFEGSAIRDFRQAAHDLLLLGWTEADLAREVEQSLPLADEIDENAPVDSDPLPF